MLDSVKIWSTDLLGPTVVEWIGRMVYLAVDPVVGSPTLRWIFLASTLFVIALYYYLRVRREDAGTPKGFWRYAFPRDIYLHPSAVVDYQFFLINGWLLALTRLGKIVLTLVALLQLGEGVTWLLERGFGPRAVSGDPGWFATACFSLWFVAAYDFGRFFSHFVQHRSEILWEFHKVHHSAEVLTPMSSFRAHPFDQALELLFRTVTSSVVVGAFAYMYPNGIQELTILNYGAVTFLFYLTAHLRHSHVPVDFGWADRWFVSPVMHQLHHSAAREHFDKNFGFIFSAWDRLFGTYMVPERGAQYRLGLPAGSGRYDSAWWLLAHPFVGVYRILAQRLRRSVASAS
jgi:sterol desaturase/sphingolipid hydroxylase (fatty acid hydroxylase superfamily)